MYTQLIVTLELLVAETIVHACCRVIGWDCSHVLLSHALLKKLRMRLCNSHLLVLSAAFA